MFNTIIIQFTFNLISMGSSVQYIYFTDSTNNNTLKADVYGDIIFYMSSAHNGLSVGSIATYYYAHQRTDNTFVPLRFVNNSIKVKSDIDVTCTAYYYTLSK